MGIKAEEEDPCVSTKEGATLDNEIACYLKIVHFSYGDAEGRHEGFTFQKDQVSSVAKAILERYHLESEKRQVKNRLQNSGGARAAYCPLLNPQGSPA